MQMNLRSHVCTCIHCSTLFDKMAAGYNSCNLDGERIKDFSSILYNLAQRQDLLGTNMNSLLEKMEKMEENVKVQAAEVTRLQRVTSLNNVFIAMRRDKGGNFEPIAIENIVKEVVKWTKTELSSQ